MNAREAAFQAVWLFLKQGDFVSNTLDKWRQRETPSSLDKSFAYEIASGSIKRSLSLDYIAIQLSERKKLSLKSIERAILRTALYQACLMQKVPLYAIVNETVQLAKKYCHATFIKFLNALLRKLEHGIPSLPEEYSANALSIKYSYPIWFVERLIDEYGLGTALAAMVAGNHPPSTMVRLRGIDSKSLPSYLELIKKDGFSMARLNDSQGLNELANSKNFYIQNIAPVFLIEELSKHTSNAPKHILDLCASPGGKILAAHDLFPNAQLHANDVSHEKTERLTENLRKYGVHAYINVGLGESYTSDKKFDLIIIDVPCSNSGVLSKRPEARWRLDQTSLNQLHGIQEALFRHAVSLLTPQGEIWYLTCSILKEENENFIIKESSLAALKPVFMRTILPNEMGWDGGFGCLLKK